VPVFKAGEGQDELKWVREIGVCTHFCWETQKQQLLHHSIQQQMRQFSAVVQQCSFVARAFGPEPTPLKHGILPFDCAVLRHNRRYLSVCGRTPRHIWETELGLESPSYLAVRRPGGQAGGGRRQARQAWFPARGASGVFCAAVLTRFANPVRIGPVYNGMAGQRERKD